MRTTTKVRCQLLTLAVLVFTAAGCDRVLTVQGHVSDLTGTPVENAVVTVCPDCPVPSTETTNRRGCFAFGVTASPYDNRDSISIEKAGYKPLTITIEDAEVAELEVVLASLEDEAQGSVDVTLMPSDQFRNCEQE